MLPATLLKFKIKSLWLLLQSDLNRKASQWTLAARGIIGTKSVRASEMPSIIFVASPFRDGRRVCFFPVPSAAAAQLRNRSPLIAVPSCDLTRRIDLLLLLCSWLCTVMGKFYFNTACRFEAILVMSPSPGCDPTTSYRMTAVK